MNKYLVAFALLLLAPFAHAGISEVKIDFSNQAGPMAASAVVTTSSGSGNASYLLCVAFNELAPGVTPTLTWKDENGNAQSWTPAPPDPPYGCHLIRNQAGATITVATSGQSSARYSFCVFGFGFWPTQPQKQGGIAETIMGVNADVKMAGGPYLILFTGSNTGCEIALGVPGGPAAVYLTAPAIFPFVASPGYVTPEQISASGTCDSSNEVAVISFGVPSAGSGPLTDYEYDLLDWANTAYPYYKTVLTGGAKGANFLLATNIAEKPNSETVAEEITPTWPGDDQVLSPSDFVAEPSGAPAAAVLLGWIPADDPVEFWTFNTTGQAWGVAPTYSAEVDAIVF